MNWLSKLFCKHNYIQYDYLPCTLKLEDGSIINVPMTLMQCEKCGKRIVLKDSDWCYNRDLLQKVDLWRRGFFNWEEMEWNKECQ